MPSVLVVDDFDLIRYLTRDILVRTYECVAVSTAEEALALLGSRRFDVLVADLKLPGMGGLELLRDVRRRLPGMPVVVVTGGVAGLFAEDCLAEGASAYLQKPFTAEELEGAVAGALAAVTPAEGEGGGGCPVLVVDDHEDVRRMLRAMLERRGCRVFEASDGREAVEAASRVHPRVVLMDLTMPVMDGFEATRRIVRGAGAEEPAVVAVSGHAVAEAREMALEAGCVGFVTKPVEAKVLEDLLGRYC